MTTRNAARRRLRAAGRILTGAVIASALGLCAAHADSTIFKGYRKSDPKRFGQGVAAYDAQNFEKAYEIWVPLAQHGDIAAMFNVALMLRDGRGIPKSPSKALAYFTQAARMGHLGSEVDLADMYMKGEGTKQNYTEAAKWLLVAARRGHLPSAYRLGRMFESGIGVKKDLGTARALYLYAAKRGYGLAATRLAILADEVHGAAPQPGPGAAAPQPASQPAEPPGDLADTSLFQLRGPLLGAGPSHLVLPPASVMRLRPSSPGANPPDETDGDSPALDAFAHHPER